LSLKEKQIDWSPFLVNKLDLENPAVLIRLVQAYTTKGKNVVIGDPRPEEDAKSTPSHTVVMEKLPIGEETITITIRGSTQTTIRGRSKGQIRLTTTESGSQPPLTRSRQLDHHGGPDQATQSHGQTTPRADQIASRDGPTTDRAG
jgi:hypothetical protein